MKTRKSRFKITALALAVFLATAGFAQAVYIYDCKGECCRDKRAGLQSQRSYLRLSPHHLIEFESVFPFCNPLNRYSDIARKVSETQDCHDEPLPPCCKVSQGNEKVEGLISPSMVRTDRLLDVGHVPATEGVVPSDNPFRAVVWSYLLPARAAPVPLYLKKSAFLY